MKILNKLKELAVSCPDRSALVCGGESLSYKELWICSDRLAAYLARRCGSAREPIAVYGHKSPWMIVCFLACVKSGHGYCPIDISVPAARVEMILDALPEGPVLAVEPLLADAGGRQTLELTEIKRIARGGEDAQDDASMRSSDTAQDGAAIQNCAPDMFSEESLWVSGGETWYIIFTSGSTGTPKGVQISADCLEHFLDWSVGLGTPCEDKQGRVFLNQAPFSFDLSVMDLYTSLVCGGTLFCLEKTVQSDYRLLMQALGRSNAHVWVSTPSFAELCLSEKTFGQELMPELAVFLFCGETLGNRTVRKLQERFRNAVIVNTYGPTESTVAVTEVPVTRELAEEEDPLPVGRAKPGTVIEIRDADGNVLPDGEKGEIVILGDTVSSGYYRQRELTDRAFFIETREDPAGGISVLRGYRTGDKGYLRDGMLYYCGRIDLQVKLHGYRIELEDIENNIRRLCGIEHAVVLPNERGGKVKSLTAYVVEDKVPEDAKAETARLKRELLTYVPEYMVPKKFVFLAQMPVTGNGKADRRRLRELVSQEAAG